MAKHEHMDDKEVRKYLAAFADGELEVEQNLRVLEQMAMNPQATRRVMHQQQLRRAIKRSIDESTPEDSDRLRETISDLAQNTPAGQITNKMAPEALSKSAGPSRTNRWAGLCWIPWIVTELQPDPC